LESSGYFGLIGAAGKATISIGSVARDEAGDGGDEDLMVPRVNLVTENGLKDCVGPYVEKDVILVA
jgi:hypothetical protein